MMCEIYEYSNFNDGCDPENRSFIMYIIVET
jgi:hypothetical protein